MTDIYQLRHALKLVMEHSHDGSIPARDAIETAMQNSAGRDKSRIKSLLALVEEFEKNGSIPPDFDAALRYLRKRLDLSLGQIETDTGVPAQILWSWENGTAPDRFQGYKYVLLLAKRFGCRMEVLWRRIRFNKTASATVRDEQWHPLVPRNTAIRRAIIARLKEETFTGGLQEIRSETLRLYGVVKALRDRNISKAHSARAQSPYRFSLKHWTPKLLTQRDAIIADINAVPEFGRLQLIGPHAPGTIDYGDQYWASMFGFGRNCRGEGRNIPLEKVSFAWVVSGKLAMETVNFIRSRRDDDRKEFSPTNDLAFLRRCARLIAEDGWVRRNSALVDDLAALEGLL